MKITIDSSVLEKEGYSMQDFAIILYYISGGTGILNEEWCNKLWESGFLKKVNGGYQAHEGKRPKLRTWFIKSSTTPDTMERLTELAKAMQEVFPSGRKSDKYYWRDSTKVIAQRLALFIKKYGDYEDDKFIQAAKNYVSSFNGNYEFMQLLKYFIYKKDTVTGEENSQLASYLDNVDDVNNTIDRDWTTNLV